MIAVIRVRGNVKVRKDIRDTLDMLKLHNVNNCVVLKETPQIMGMVRKVKDYVTYGEISKDVFRKMLLKWGRIGRRRIKEEDIKGFGFESTDAFVDAVFEGKIKLKEFVNVPFRLHPPKGGWKSIKKPYPKGALGYRGEAINEVLLRMIGK